MQIQPTTLPSANELEQEVLAGDYGETSTWRYELIRLLIILIIICRTASDLEEIGMIDKYQKGYIKDLIISGDSTFQAILEKYEKGDKKELEGNI